VAQELSDVSVGHGGKVVARVMRNGVTLPRQMGC